MSESLASIARWEHFNHGSDIGIRGLGANKSQAFEMAALALTAIIADPATVRPSTKIEIRCQSVDDEFLLMDWINALIYQMATQKMLFNRFEVSLNDYFLHAVALGEPIDIKRHSPAVEPKGATWTELKVEKNAEGNWLAQCVVDV